MRRDHVRRNDPDKKVSHPFLKPTIGVKMEVAGRMSRLLGLTCYYRGGELPSRIVGIARREALGESTDADRDFVKQLKHLVTEINAACFRQRADRRPQAPGMYCHSAGSRVGGYLKG